MGVSDFTIPSLIREAPLDAKGPEDVEALDPETGSKGVFVTLQSVGPCPRKGLVTFNTALVGSHCVGY